MNRLADSGARNLDTGETYRFQDNLLDRETKKNAKATSRDCGRWPKFLYADEAFVQALSPARLGALIRWAGLGAAKP